MKEFLLLPLDLCRLSWRLGLRRLGLVPLTFDPAHWADQRLEKLLLFRRYGKRRPDLKPAECRWRRTREGVWVLELPHRLGAIQDDPDLFHVRLASSHGDKERDFRPPPLPPANTAPPETDPPKSSTTAEEDEEARRAYEEANLPDTRGVTVVPGEPDNQKLCPTGKHRISKDASVCYHCQRNEGHPRTRTR